MVVRYWKNQWFAGLLSLVVWGLIPTGTVQGQLLSDTLYERKSNRLRIEFSPTIIGRDLQSSLQNGNLLRISWMSPYFPFDALSPALDFETAFLPGINQRSVFIYSLSASATPFAYGKKMVIKPVIGFGLQTIRVRNMINVLGSDIPIPSLDAVSKEVFPDLHLGLRLHYKLNDLTEAHLSIIQHTSSANVSQFGGGSIRMIEVISIGITRTLGVKSFKYKRFEKDFARANSFAARWDKHWDTYDEKADSRFWNLLPFRQDVLRKHQKLWARFLQQYPESKDYGADQGKVIKIIKQALDNRNILALYGVLDAITEEAERRLGDIVDFIDSLHRFIPNTPEDVEDSSLYNQLIKIERFSADHARMVKNGQIESSYEPSLLNNAYFDSYDGLLTEARNSLDSMSVLIKHLEFEKAALKALAINTYPAFEKFFSMLPESSEDTHGYIIKSFKKKLIKSISTELDDEKIRRGLTKEYVKTLFLFFDTVAGKKYFEDEPQLDKLRGQYSKYLRSAPVQPELRMGDKPIEEPPRISPPIALPPGLIRARDRAENSNSIQPLSEFLALYTNVKGKLKNTSAESEYRLAATTATNAINTILFRNQTAKNCEPCHQEIYDEWKVSYHGLAWVDPVFKSATQGYTKKECLACHAPKPLMETGLVELPLLREDNLDEGINCYSCHANGNTIHGPLGEETIFHITSHNSAFRSVQMCQSCHPSNFNEWQERGYPLDEEKYRCQSCHMSRLKTRRRASQYGPIRAGLLMHDWRGAHSTEKLKEAFNKVSVKADGKTLELSVQIINNAAAHNVPSGISGRKFTFIAQMLDKNKDQLDPGRKGTLLKNFERTIKGAEGPAVEVTVQGAKKDGSIRQGSEWKYSHIFKLLPEARFVDYRIVFYMNRADKKGRVLVEKRIKVL